MWRPAILTQCGGPQDQGRKARRHSKTNRAAGSRPGWRRRRVFWIALGVVVLLTVAGGVAMAQVAPSTPGTMPRNILTAYEASKIPAITAFNQYAGRLFRALALVEMAWAAVLLALERSDLQSWMAGFLRKFLVLFAFLYLLQNGPDFSDRIINSFTDIGSQVASMPSGASPGDVFFEGVYIAGTLLSKTDWTGFLFNPAPAVMVILSALIIFLSFIVISIHYIMAMVESYIVVSAGLIFLGFGGNTITRPYVERFFALAVAVGVKIMVLYVVIGVGRVLTTNWGTIVNNISLDVFPVSTVLELIGGSLVYAAVAWGVPKFAASLLGGSPAFTGGDLISVGMAGAQMGLLAAGGAGLALRGGAMLAGAGAAGSSSAGGTSIASAASFGSGPGPAGPKSPSGGGGGGKGGDSGSGSGGAYSPQQPPPPKHDGPASGGGGVSGSDGDGAAPAAASVSGTYDKSAPGGGAGTAVAMAQNSQPPRSVIRSVDVPPAGALPATPPSNAWSGSEAGSTSSSPASGGQANAPATTGQSGAAQQGEHPSIGKIRADVPKFMELARQKIAAESASPPSVGAASESGAGSSSPEGASASPPSVGAAAESPVASTSTSGAGGTSVQPPSGGGNQSEDGKVERAASPSSSASLSNPQTLENPQTVTSPQAVGAPMSVGSPMKDSTFNEASQRPPNQVSPPGWEAKAMDKAGRTLFGAAMRAHQLAFYAKHMFPPDNAGGGAPPQMNIHE